MKKGNVTIIKKNINRIWTTFQNKTGLFSICFAVILAVTYFTSCGSEFATLLDENSSSGTGAIYWTEFDGTINSIYTSGEGETTILTIGNTPLGIAVDSAGGKIYWTEFTGTDDELNRASIDGTGIETLLSNPATSNFGPTTIAIDPVNRHVYWNYYHNASGHNDLWRSPLDSFSDVKWMNTFSNDYTYDISMDSTNRKIYVSVNTYWDISGSAGSGNSGVGIYGEMDTINSYSSPIAETGPVADSTSLRGLASDGTYIYYVSNSTTDGLKIKRAENDFQSRTDWITTPPADISKIAIDLKNRKIYWTSQSDNAIYRADLDSPDSNIEKFLDLDSRPHAITIDN